MRYLCIIERPVAEGAGERLNSVGDSRRSLNGISDKKI